MLVVGGEAHLLDLTEDSEDPFEKKMILLKRLASTQMLVVDGQAHLLDLNKDSKGPFEK